MGECLGICERYETTGVAGYVKGFKWCTRCHLFIRASTRICPCCKTQLRVKSRETLPIEVKKLSKKKYPHLRLLATSPKGHYFGAFENISQDAEQGYDFFISTTQGVKDWCECLGFVHGKLCYHIKESKKRFESLGGMKNG